MGHNGCDGSRASGPWAIGSRYRFSICCICHTGSQQGELVLRLTLDLPPPATARGGRHCARPAHNPGLDTYARGDEPDDPHIWGTWEGKSLDTLLSIRSGNQGVGRAMYCLAKWTQQTWGIFTDRWLWRVTLRPQQREAPRNSRGPTPPRPTTPQLCPYMMAARLMALLWPGPDRPPQNYPHLTEEDMPGIQRCFFRTLHYLQQTQPHVLEQIWPPSV